MTTLKVKHLVTLLYCFEEYKGCTPLLYLLAKLHDLTPYDVEQRFANAHSYWGHILDNKTLEIDEAKVKKLQRFTDSFLKTLTSGGWEEDCLSARRRQANILHRIELSPQALFQHQQDIIRYLSEQQGSFRPPIVAIQGDTVHITTTFPIISREDNKP